MEHCSVRRDSRPEDLELPLEASRGSWYGQKHQFTFCGLNGVILTFPQQESPARLDEATDLERYGIASSMPSLSGSSAIASSSAALPALAREALRAHHLLRDQVEPHARPQIEALARRPHPAQFSRAIDSP